MPSPQNPSPMNPMDAACSSASLSFRRMTTAASGPLGLSNPNLVLSEAEALSKALVFIKANARAEIARRKREARENAKLAAKNADRNQSDADELARRRAEQARYEGRSRGDYIADGLVALAQAAA